MAVIEHALIMAAGRGMRMAPLTESMPKPMAPYDGTTLIASGIDKLRPHIPNVHITVGYKGAMLAQHVIEHDVSSVFNTEGRENSWWIFNTPLRYLDQPIYVLTCDNVLELDFKLLQENYFDLGSPPNMVVPVEVIPGLEGDFIKAEGNIVTDLGRDFEADIYCSGIQILNPKKIIDLTEDVNTFYDIWAQLIKQEQLVVSSVYPNTWMAVDTIEQLIQLNNHNRPA